MDNHIGDLHPAIVGISVFLCNFHRAECVDREIEIIQELLDKVLRYGPAMEDASTVCAELDCLVSFAEAARTFNYRRPRMVEDPILNIVQGRYVCFIHQKDDSSSSLHETSASRAGLGYLRS